jgi:NAD(P) transhydrogenase subunit beta
MEYIQSAYLLSAICFIYGLKKLSHPKTARHGNTVASVGMLIAIIATLAAGHALSWPMMIIGVIIGSIIGTVIAIKIPMTGMPQMVALLNGLGGGASALVAMAEFLKFYPAVSSTTWLVSTILSVLIGWMTFSGSFIAFAKLQELICGQPVAFKGQKLLNGVIALVVIMGSVIMLLSTTGHQSIFWIITLLSIVLGVLMVLPIGGADMPVVISLLNALSGVAAAATGFVLMNSSLVITGALVGASGLILTQIMCKGMNRSLYNVLFGAVGKIRPKTETGKEIHVKSTSTEELAMILDAADKIIIVPGYGLAVAQAQHAVREIANFLEKKGKTVLYGIHPVAGRMPGHMNVLLAEANISYELLKDIDQINPEFEACDVVLVLGANDVVNPAARKDPHSPLYGMPILNVDKAKTVIVNKRSMRPGFAGIDNELFGHDNTLMIFGDAKEMLNKLLADLKEL